MSSPSSLSTLTEWAHAFTHGMFETDSDVESSLAFFDDKVASDAKFNINGTSLTAAQVKAHWANGRNEYVSQTIRWQHTAELPKDHAKPKEGGIVTGYYINTGYYKKPADPALPAFVFKRTPHIFIESQNPESKEDTRRLVGLTVISIETAVANLDEYK